MRNYLTRQLVYISSYPLVFLAIAWLVFLLQSTLDHNFLRYGISPRDTSTLPGIITSVFIHGDINHLASNSIPLLVLGMMLFYFYKKIAKGVALWIWVVSGIWLWVGGRNSEQHHIYHIGASTLIYGLAAFLFFSGVFRRHTGLMFVSALVVFLYGSLMWGIFPFKPEMSWEGHLFGAVAGVLVAFNYRKEGPQRRVYRWEEEEEEGPEAGREPGAETSETDEAYRRGGEI